MQLRDGTRVLTVTRAITVMTIDDAGHYTPEERESIVASYLPHEREARAKGIPVMGSGRVFQIPEDSIKCDPIPIPAHWYQIAGIDFGWDHPSAAVRMAWDKDSDTVYIVDCHRQREQTPQMFALSLKEWPKWLPVSWPHDGLQHDKGSGEQLAQIYRKTGLKMLAERATFNDGSNGVEAGVQEMMQRMELGKFKVFSHLADWFEEFRMYHRDSGKIVKERDDLMSATRYAWMMRRYGLSVMQAEHTQDIQPQLPDADGIYF